MRGAGLLVKRRIEQSLSHRITREHYAVFRKETFHTLISHAYLACLLCQGLVGHASVRVLLLNKTWDAHRRGSIECWGRSISTHSNGCVGMKFAYGFPYLALALQIVEHHADIFQAIQWAYESAHWQTHNLISSSRHTLHLHASFCSHEEDFSIWALCFYGISYGNSREYMSSRTASAYDYPKFFIHSNVCSPNFIWQK